MGPAFLSAVNAYDIRGIVPTQIDATFCRELGYAFAAYLVSKNETRSTPAIRKTALMTRVLLGHDIRLSGPEFVDNLAIGLSYGGVGTSTIGLCGTEEVYHAVAEGQFSGGIMVTASHNPKAYNGFKLVGAQATPIFGESGLTDIIDLILQRVESGRYGRFDDQAQAASSLDVARRVSYRSTYIDKVLSCVDLDILAGLKIVLNTGNGSAGPVVKELASYLPMELVLVHEQPDGSFPNGVPNPLLPDGRDVTARAVLAHSADFGVAFDGDFDRCFFFDEYGRFIEGYYLVSLLAEYFLSKASISSRANTTILHDPRLYWGTREIVSQMGGKSIQGKTGHAFMKQLMRESGAVYGGEMSAHHYFRDFYCCDSGMFPWLIVASLVANKGSLSSQVAQRMSAFPTRGEINISVSDIDAVLMRIQDFFTNSSRNIENSLSCKSAERAEKNTNNTKGSPEDPERLCTELDRSCSEFGQSQRLLAAEQPIVVEHVDGLSMSFSDWRFNLRASNTEPLLRLNLESRANRDLMEKQTNQLLDLITQFDV